MNTLNPWNGPEMAPALGSSLVKDILNYLGCRPEAPTLRYLNRLIHAYIRQVPWESVSRIIKRHTVASTADCPRWPEEFWDSALRYGFGGTCFESTLAFYSLLTSLGFEGYLTVNDMAQSRACHAANVVLVNGARYLVDVTIPLHASIRIDPLRTSRRETAYHNYKLQPSGKNVYDVGRTHHPQRNIFTFIDTPISLPDYQTIVTKDYSETGHFLKSVVMVKVIDDRVWRFFSDHRPYKVESFNRNGKSEAAIPIDAMAPFLADRFQLPQRSVSDALSYING